MLVEIIWLLAKGMSEILFGTIRSMDVALQYFIMAAQVFGSGIASASLAEVLAIFFIFGVGGYLAYKFFWDSAKEVVILVIVIFILFLAMAFAI